MFYCVSPIIYPSQTLSEIASRAADLKISQLQLVENIHDNKAPDIKPPIKRKAASFVQTIRSLRKLDKEVYSFAIYFYTNAY